MSATFRERRRTYGVHVPVQEVEAHIANGWELAEDPADAPTSETVLMRPPRSQDGAAA